MAVKYVFVTGGVVSGLGQGITAASLGRLLKARGYQVTMQKFDPYINIDPGTMNPIQHGEVFVTDDGTETDLDLYSLKVVLRDKESGEVVYESEGDTYGLKENTALYSFLKHSVDVESGRTYQLEITSDAPQNSGIGLYCVEAGKALAQLVEPRSEEHEEKRSLQMCITGVE